MVTKPKGEVLIRPAPVILGSKLHFMNQTLLNVAGFEILKKKFFLPEVFVKYGYIFGGHSYFAIS